MLRSVSGENSKIINSTIQKHNPSEIRLDDDESQKRFYYDHERFLSLQKEFIHINPNNPKELTKAEIVVYLTKKMKNKLKEDYLTEILNLMDENKEGKVLQEEFCHCYLKKELELKNHVNHLILECDKLKSEKESLQNSLKLKERMQRKSYLKIYCSQANLNKKFGLNSYAYKYSVRVVFSINNYQDDQVESTKLSSNCLFPNWNDTLMFEVQSDKITLVIRVIKKEPTQEKKEQNEVVMSQNEEPIGEITLRFDRLDSGVLKEGWMDIIDTRDKVNLIGQILCRIEYIHAEEYVIENRLRDIEDRLQVIAKEKTLKEDKGKYYSRMFGNPVFAPQKTMSPPEPESFMQFLENMPESNFSGGVIIETELNKNKILARDWLPKGIVLLCLFVNYSRADYISILLMLSANMLEGKLWNSYYFRFLLIIMIFSFILDFFWLYIYGGVWSGVENNIMGPQISVQRMSWIFSIFSLLAKAGYLVFLVLSKEFRKEI